MEKKRKYKILMIAPRPFYVDVGFSVQILEEYKALRDIGNDVLLCCYHLGDDLEDVNISRAVKVPWYTNALRKVSFHYAYLDFLLLIHSIRAAKKFQPDVIHAHIHEGGLIGLFISKLLKIPMVLDIQGSMLGEYRERGLPDVSPITNLISVIERKVNENADAIMFEVEYRKDTASELSTISKEKIFHFKLGMDTDLFSRKPRDNNLLRDLQIPEDRKVIGFIGLMTHYQGIDHLLESMQIINKTRKDIHLLLMGFPNIDFYKAKSRELGIEGYVSFTGKMPYRKAPQYLSLCDIAVSPKISLQETNGKLINYMSMGLPVVVFDTPINREYLEDLGVYAKLKDSEDFARCILELIDDYGERMKLSTRLRERALSKFSLGTMAQSIMNMYDKVVDRYTPDTQRKLEKAYKNI